MDDYYQTAEYLRLAAAQNRRYADLCEETYASTGRASALHQAELHRACAAQKEAQANKLEEVKRREPK